MKIDREQVWLNYYDLVAVTPSNLISIIESEFLKEDLSSALLLDSLRKYTDSDVHDFKIDFGLFHCDVPQTNIDHLINRFVRIKQARLLFSEDSELKRSEFFFRTLMRRATDECIINAAELRDNGAIFELFGSDQITLTRVNYQALIQRLKYKEDRVLVQQMFSSKGMTEEEQRRVADLVKSIAKRRRELLDECDNVIKNDFIYAYNLLHALGNEGQPLSNSTFSESSDLYFQLQSDFSVNSKTVDIHDIVVSLLQYVSGITSAPFQFEKQGDDYVVDFFNGKEILYRLLIDFSNKWVSRDGGASFVLLIHGNKHYPSLGAITLNNVKCNSSLETYLSCINLFHEMGHFTSSLLLQKFYGISDYQLLGIFYEVPAYIFENKVLDELLINNLVLDKEDRYRIRKIASVLSCIYKRNEMKNFFLEHSVYFSTDPVTIDFIDLLPASRTFEASSFSLKSHLYVIARIFSDYVLHSVEDITPLYYRPDIIDEALTNFFNICSSSKKEL